MKVRVLPYRPKSAAVERNVAEAFDTNRRAGGGKGILDTTSAEMGLWCKWINTADF